MRQPVRAQPGGSKLAGPNVSCAPDSDSNVYTGTKPTQKGGSNYIGQHPGGAYMEMQVYPPGWVEWPPGDSCNPTRWCAALNIDSYNLNGGTAYGRVALEADLPRIEVPSLSPDNSCNRTTGAGCVNPPNSPTGKAFYPVFSLGSLGGSCVWQLGGAHITGANDAFGTTSTAAFGPLLQLTYPGTSGVIYRYNDFRNVASVNPC